MESLYGETMSKLLLGTLYDIFDRVQYLAIEDESDFS